MLSMMQMVSVPVTFVIPILAGRMKDQRMLTAITCTCLIMGYAFLLSGISSLVTIGVVLAGIGGELHLAWLRCSLYFGLRTQDKLQDYREWLNRSGIYWQREAPCCSD